MDWACDLYAYDSVSGNWVCHVAANRVIGDIPKAAHLFDASNIVAFMEAHRRQMEFLETAKREPIGGPHDGETFE